jgi:hypothetical protein
MELGDHAGSPDAETKRPLGHAFTLAQLDRAGEGIRASSFSIGCGYAARDDT